MTFFSHSKELEDGKVAGSKLLKTHTQGVLDKALAQFYKKVDLGFEEAALKELLTLIIKLHDLGKYTSYFQNYLLQREPIDYLLKQHARIGGVVAYQFLKDKDEKLAVSALYLIFLHHSKLIAIDDIPKKIDNKARNIFESQKTDIQKVVSLIEDELGIKEFAKHLVFPEERNIRKTVKVWTKREANIQDYFTINYLFSLLIEADKLDASDTPQYRYRQLTASSVDERFSKPEILPESVDLDKLSNHELRNYCRAEVIRNLEKEDILDHYLFTLTAPTGIGKTMTALDFALKLKSKILAEDGFNAPIIYALPFINIIEQALDEYKKTLPKEVKILGHYQYADVFGSDKSNDEQNYNQKLMSLDTWQADIVITSFVQFFETLIGYRNKLLKKFNHLAGAIIILDEVQTLRLDQMPLIGASLYYLSKFLKSRIILMTATKPKIFELAQQEILDKEGEKLKSLELLNNYQPIFETFQRTKIIPLLGQELDKDRICQDFVDTVFSEKWKTENSCLLVCNTVKRSIELYEAITSFLQENNYSNPVFYLSTNIVPAHRFERIQLIKKAQEDRLAPILISTQVVEAGVDLDFDMGFRDVGPIDSIIQVAGRINRNNNIDKRNAPLYIIDFKDAQRIYGRITYDQAFKALKQKSEFPEKDYLTLVTSYFDNIADRSSFTTYKKVFDAMKILRYDSEIKEDYPVSSFRIIDEAQTTQPVFIELGEYEADLRRKYLQKIKGKISKEAFDQSFRRDFQQRIIAVPEYLTKELDHINPFEENIKVVPQELLTYYYHAETGFIRDQQQIIFML